MKNRKKRVEAIIRILTENNISSQEQLQSILIEEGYSVTQATLSRDLKTLKTVKVPTDLGVSVYVIPGMDTLKEKLLTTGNLPRNANFGSGLVSIKFSGNLAVLKTRNGYASGLAYDIDTSGAEEILGTIPGSDTILVVLREDVSHEAAKALFDRILNPE